MTNPYLAKIIAMASMVTKEAFEPLVVELPAKQEENPTQRNALSSSSVTTEQKHTETIQTKQTRSSISKTNDNVLQQEVKSQSASEKIEQPNAIPSRISTPTQERTVSSQTIVHSPPVNVQQLDKTNPQVTTQKQEEAPKNETTSAEVQKKSTTKEEILELTRFVKNTLEDFKGTTVATASTTQHKSILRTTKKVPRRTYKMALLGDAGVGKTCIVHAMLGDEFGTRQATIGMAEDTLDCEYEDGTHASLEIYDTAGSERTNSLALGYLRTMDVIVIVYSLGVQRSFDNVGVWYGIAEGVARSKKARIVLVRSKIDAEGSVYDDEVGKKKAAAIGAATFLPASSKAGTNIDMLVQLCLALATESAASTPTYDSIGSDMDGRDRCIRQNPLVEVSTDSRQQKIPTWKLFDGSSSTVHSAKNVSTTRLAASAKGTMYDTAQGSIIVLSNDHATNTAKQKTYTKTTSMCCR